MLVEENGEKMYTLVGEKKITSTLSGRLLNRFIFDKSFIAEYKNHRPVGVPAPKVNGNRLNPFTNTTCDNVGKGLNENVS